MRDCVVLGSARSGSSLTAGTLAEAGCLLGRRLIAPNVSNPKGYFEDRALIDIHEALLPPYVSAAGAPPGAGAHNEALAEGEWCPALLRPDVQGYAELCGLAGYAGTAA